MRGSEAFSTASEGYMTDYIFHILGYQPYPKSQEQYGYILFMTGRGICSVSIAGRLGSCWSRMGCKNSPKATFAKPSYPLKGSAVKCFLGSGSSTLPEYCTALCPICTPVCCCLGTVQSVPICWMSSLISSSYYSLG